MHANLVMTMRHITTYVLLLIGITCAYAVPIYEYDTPATQGFQSHKILNAGTVYQGTTYAPFDDAAPSDYSEVGGSYSPNNAPSGPRRGKITGPDTPPANEYPIGEPWILMIFGALFAGVIAWKKRTFHGIITGPSSEEKTK